MKPKDELSFQANDLRRKFGEDIFSPIDIFPLLQTHEDKTLIFYPLSSNISGMCIRNHSGDQIIAINSKSTYGRQRFTAAHELYHLYVQEGFKSVVCGFDIGHGMDEEEKNADCFASYFLAPNDGLRTFIEKILKKGRNNSLSIDDVVRIEQYFGMSRQATLYRLVGDKYIKLDYANSLKTKIIASARNLGFDEKLYIPSQEEKQYFTIGNYIKIAEKLRRNGIISIGKYEEFLLEAFRSDMVFTIDGENQELYD